MTYKDYILNSINDYLRQRNVYRMFLTPVNKQELTTVVNLCKHKTSTDLNDINMSLVKQIINYTVKPFTHICNTSFQMGVFPNNMKIKKVIYAFKSGEITYLILIDLFRFYHSIKQILKNYAITG